MTTRNALRRKLRRKIEELILRLLPKKIIKLLGLLYGFLKSPKKSYSQYGEDLIIENFCTKYNIQNGVYLDIGAFHPKWLSNTYLLDKRGWKGFVVDIDVCKIEAFQGFRKNSDGIVAAVTPGPSNEKVNIYKFDRMWSELDTLSLADAQRYKDHLKINFKTDTIESININNLLSIVINKYGKINFINIDIEGLDEKIIEKIDFSKFKPELICFENNLSFGGSPYLINFLQCQGYQLLFSSGGTHGYFKTSSLKILSN